MHPGLLMLMLVLVIARCREMMGHGVTLPDHIGTGIAVPSCSGGGAIVSVVVNVVPDLRVFIMLMEMRVGMGGMVGTLLLRIWIRLLWMGMGMRIFVADVSIVVYIVSIVWMVVVVVVVTGALVSRICRYISLHIGK